MTRFREGQPYDSPPAYSGKIDLDGIWNVPLAQIERDRPPTWSQPTRRRSRAPVGTGSLSRLGLAA